MPTLTPSPTYIPTLAAPDELCISVPRGWVLYTVQEGDTLFAIAQAMGVTVVDMLRINCLSDADSITAGMQIYVPREPANAIPTGMPPGVMSANTAVCHDPNSAQISNPNVGQEVSGLLTIVGTANLPDFSSYRIDIRRPEAEAYEYLLSFGTPVVNGVLGQLNTELLENGLYWIRLSVVNRSSNVPFTAICSIAVYIDN